MERQTDTCRHCGKPGKLKYYYLGLKGKVKQWVASPEMCRRMTGHWKEKEHWLEKEKGWHIKKEVWDGDRFCELSGVCQQSAKQRTARILLLEKPLKVCLQLLRD